MTVKLNEKKYPRNDEVIWHDDSINNAITRLERGEAVWVCSRKLSLLIRRYGKEVTVEPVIWKKKVIFKVSGVPLSRNS